MKSVLTTCPFCSCGCAMYLTHRDGRLTGVSPSEHHPVSRASLCARGWHAHEAPAWGQRLRHPLIRRNGALERASWDQALECASRGLRDAHARGDIVGALGSARATNEENHLLARLARRAFESGHVDTCGGAVGGAVGGATSFGSLRDVAASELVIVVADELERSHPAAARAVMSALREGARVVLFGLANTRLARIVPLHIAAGPGARAHRLASFAAMVANPGDGDDGGMPADGVLSTAANWFRAARRTSILHVARAGSGLVAAAEWSTLAALARPAPGVSPGADAAFLSLAPRANARGAFEAGVHPDPGCPPAGELIASAGALVILAEDPSTSLRDGDRVLASIGAKSCSVVLDAFRSRASDAATVVLPIAAFGETDGSMTNCEGRRQPVRAVIPPPGDARPGWQALAMLSARLGIAGDYRNADDVIAEAAGGTGLPGDAARATVRAHAAEPAPGTMSHELEAGLPSSARARHCRLGIDGAYDWGRDPLVLHSPTLSRDSRAERKLSPGGLIQLSRADAQALGLRQGWTARVVSRHGEGRFPVRIRPELDPGVALVPIAFEDPLRAVLGDDDAVTVRVENPA